MGLVGFLGRCLCSYLIFWQVMEQRTSPCQKYGTSWTNFSYLTPLCALACILRLGAIMVVYKRGFQIFANIYFGSTAFLCPIGWVAIPSPAAQNKQCQWGETKQTSHPPQSFLDNSILVWVLLFVTNAACYFFISYPSSKRLRRFTWNNPILLSLQPCEVG